MSYVSEKMSAYKAKQRKNGSSDARTRVRPVVPKENAENIQGLLAPHLPAAIQAWVDGLGATKIIWVKGECIDTGIADHIVRSNCAQKIVEYLVGKAIERSMEISGNYRELSEILSELEQTPEAKRLLSHEVFDSLHKACSVESAMQPHDGKESSDSEQKTG